MHSIRLISFGYLPLPTGPDGQPVPPAADRIEDVRDRLRDPAAARDILDLDGFHPRVQDVVLNTPAPASCSPTSPTTPTFPRAPATSPSAVREAGTAPLTGPRSPEMTNCVFCSIATGEAPAVVVREWPDALAIRPRTGGVTDGHVMVLPRVHVEDAGTDPEVTATVMRRAAELMAELPAANIITSKGAAATQTVYHLHVHVVPRAAGDGLPLPWTPQQTAAAARQAGGER